MASSTLDLPEPFGPTKIVKRFNFMQTSFPIPLKFSKANKGSIGRTWEESKPWWPQPTKAPTDAPNIYRNRLHREVEKIIELSGINYTFLRPMPFMQNYLGFADSIRTQGTFSLPVGDSKTCFVDTRDIAAVAVQALTKSNEHRNKAYNITGPDAISNYEIAEILSNIAEKRITYMDVSDNDARQRMKNSGMQEWAVDSLMELFGFQKGGNASVVSPDVERNLPVECTGSFL
jgi:hypothetical protein